MSHSLAFFKFKKSLEREVRNFWSISVASEFSKSWLNQFDQKTRLTDIANEKSPFSSINIPCEEYISQLPTVIEHSRENSLINIITTFEVYLFEILSRIIYLKPDCLSDSEMQFDAWKITLGMCSDNFKLWFSNEVTDKMIRNKQHSEIIKKIAKFWKCDLSPIQDKISEWNQWTYVRNSIVHTWRRVSSDLNKISPKEFPNIWSKLNISDSKIRRIASLADDILEHMDKRISETTIDFADASLLARELFIRYWIKDVPKIKKTLQKTLSFKANKEQVDKALSFQRKTNSSTNEVDFTGFIEEIVNISWIL